MSTTFARSPRKYRQKPGYYEQQTKVPESLLKDRGLIWTRITEIKDDHAFDTVTLEECQRREEQWDTLYRGQVADHRGEDG